MKIGPLITKALNLLDTLRDFPGLSEEAENKVFVKVGEIIQIIIEDYTGK